MSNNDIVYMVVILTLMSSEHFIQCINYVRNTEMQREERDFMEKVVEIASEKRKKGGTVI